MTSLPAVVMAGNETRRLRGLAGAAAAASSITGAPKNTTFVTRFSNWTDEALREYIMKPYSGGDAGVAKVASFSTHVKTELDDVKGRLDDLEAPDWADMIGSLSDSIDALRGMYDCVQKPNSACGWTDWLDQITAFLSGLSPFIVFLFPVGGGSTAIIITISRLIARVIVALNFGDSVVGETTSKEMLDRINERIGYSAGEINSILIDVKSTLSTPTLTRFYIPQLTAQIRTLDTVTDPMKRQEHLELAKELLYRNEQTHNLQSQTQINIAYEKFFGTATSIRRQDFVGRLPFDSQCNTDGKCLHGAAQNLIKRQYDKARQCHNDMLHVKGLLEPFRNEAVRKFHEYVNTYSTLFLSLSARLMSEVFEELPDEDRLRDKHDFWRETANNIAAKLRTAQKELNKCGLVVRGFQNDAVNETELRNWKDNAFAQVCNSNGFCNFNNMLGRCADERIPPSEENTGAAELRRDGTREVGTCGYFRGQYRASHGFGQNLFEAHHTTKKVADHCYDMFRGSTGWWRCFPQRSYPYALPNYCASTACARIFQDEDWWMNREKSNFP